MPIPQIYITGWSYFQEIFGRYFFVMATRLCSWFGLLEVTGLRNNFTVRQHVVGVVNPFLLQLVSPAVFPVVIGFTILLGPPA